MHNSLKLIFYLLISKFVLYVGYIVIIHDSFHHFVTAWDSANFEYISIHGYNSAYYYAFSPIYPLLIKSLNYIIHRTSVSALLLTNALSFIPPIVINKVFNYRTALLFTLFPTYIVFTTIPYSDVIPLVFLSLSFLALKNKKLLTSSILVSIAIASFYNLALTLPSYLIRWKKLHYLIIPIVIGL
ncbi:hypothetical protein, partial [Acidianus sp. RZ1]|uniref:hypothetical protein n=1 Tax=Acidianus sp. RZ1 TaxID=1540082 RepID=UPI001817A339